MSKGLGGLIIAKVMVDDMERFVSNSRERRVARQVTRASRARHWAGFGHRRAGRAKTAAGRGQAPAFPEP